MAWWWVLRRKTDWTLPSVDGMLSGRPMFVSPYVKYNVQPEKSGNNDRTLQRRLIERRPLDNYKIDDDVEADRGVGAAAGHRGAGATCGYYM